MLFRTLRDFEITITRLDQGFAASMRTPDGRRVRTTFSYPFKEYELELYIANLTRGPQPTRRSAATPDVAARQVGEALFATLFAGEALERLNSTLDKASDQQEGIRIRIDITGAPELAGLPWEYLYHPRGFFLSLDPNLSMVRYVQVQEPVRSLQVELPLRILAVACSPKDLEALDTAAERQQLEQSVRKLLDAKMVEIDWAQENSFAAVTSMLDRRDYHIFHFMGHGAVLDDEQGSQGYLMFEDAEHGAVPVSAERLGQAFRRTVRLALINACEGAIGDMANPANGVATSLLQQGVPAVVAMQFTISDHIAVQFASDFYSAIAVGLPVDAAVTSARRNVWAGFDDSAEWATPVLFMRSPDGQIFDLGQVQARDTKTAQLQQEVYSSTMENLDLDLAQLKSIIAKGSRNLMERLSPLIERVARSSASGGAAVDEVEEMYLQASTAMQQERWAEADRLFDRINKRAPGYKDIVTLWQRSKVEKRLTDIYGRMVSCAAKAQWHDVLRSGEAILREAPNYKNALEIYNQARRVLGLPPRPAVLPSGAPSAPAPSRPPSLPTSTQGPETRPPDLPESRSPTTKSNKPSNLPGE